MRRVLDWVADRLGYVDLRVAEEWVKQADRESYNRGYQRGRDNGYVAGDAAGRRSFGLSVEEAARRKAGEIEAERNGYKAQLEQTERRLRAANRRLERNGFHPVVSYLR